MIDLTRATKIEKEILDAALITYALQQKRRNDAARSAWMRNDALWRLHVVERLRADIFDR